MNDLASLIACAGSWQGTNTLQDPHAGRPEESASTATVTPVLGGRFVRLDYTWGYQGKPQEGSILIGFDAKAETFTAHWIDSWHMGNKVMACTGSKTDGPMLSVLGSWAAPPGPDWGWRTGITPEEGPSLRIVMFNVWPEGDREDLACEASYTRAEGKP